MKEIRYVLFSLIISIILIGCAGQEIKNDPSEIEININSTNSTFDRVLVAWNYPVGFPEGNVGYYELYRDTTGNVEITPDNLVSTILPIYNTFTDTSNITENTQYYYRILFKDLNDVVVDVSEAKPVGTSTREDVDISLSTEDSPVLSIRVENYYPEIEYAMRRATGSVSELVSSNSDVILTGEISGGTRINYSDSSALDGQTYSYQVTGYLLATGLSVSTTDSVQSEVREVSY